MGGNNQSRPQSRSQSTVSLQSVTQHQGFPYDLGEKIGEGNFGTVHKGKHQQTKEIVAIKKLKKVNPREAETLKKANHKNIVRLIEFHEVSEITFIVLEFCEHGSLDVYLEKIKPTTEVRKQFIKDMCAGLAYLHRIPIIHRDLKPANILVSRNGVAKIADFGQAKLVVGPDSEVNVDKIYMGTAGGTLAYMAPEVMQRHYNLQADIFSLGLLFCATLSDELKRKIGAQCTAMMVSKGDHSLTLSNLGDDFMEKLITNMLKEDYHERPKARVVYRQIMQHDGPVKQPNLSSVELVAAGIEACTGVEVLLPGEAAKLPGHPNVRKITIHDFFHFTNPAMSFNEKRETDVVDENLIDIFVKSQGGSTGVFGISSDATVSDLRKLISLNSHLPGDYLELFHRACRIEDETPIRQEGIKHGSVVHAHSVGSSQVLYEMDESLLDPGYNYNFKKLNDGNTQYFRGDHTYQRPCGWYRHALKVKGQYEDDIWLGEQRSRTDSSPNEWPVSYHGSKMRNNCIVHGSIATNKPIQGVFTTPSLDIVADKFAETFYFEGHTYQIALQNRVNPDKKNGNMVVIPGEGSEESVEYWLSSKGYLENGFSDVRPYGIIVRLVDDD